MTDYRKEPWKHEINWKRHVYRKTLGIVDSVEHCFATCECRWSVSFPTGVRCEGLAARDAALHQHWLDNIAAAESAPA